MVEFNRGTGEVGQAKLERLAAEGHDPLAHKYNDLASCGKCSEQSPTGPAAAGVTFDHDEACAVHSVLHRALHEWPEKFQEHERERIRRAVAKVDALF